MKIFHWKYVRPLQEASSLLEIVAILSPWIDEVVYPGSPFLRQVVSFSLQKFGGSTAPRSLKEYMAEILLSLNSKEDIRSAIFLSIVEAYRVYEYNRGTDLVSFLSWRVPYYCSKYLLIFPTAGNIEREVVDTISSFEELTLQEALFEASLSSFSIAKQKKRYYSAKIALKEL